jgi:dolichyl-phosphate beta-glucosyltransferase
MLLRMPGLAIIIPCYNEEARLNKSAIADLVEGLDDARLYFVNDGSRDNTLATLTQLAGSNPSKISVISFSVNEGKAKAIYKGIQQVNASGKYQYVGYMDADFSTPPSEFIKLFQTIRDQQALFVFGSRIKKLNSGINRTPFRHITGRVISTLIDLYFKLGVYDTQCGAKIFAADALEAAFEQPFWCNWLFDVEVFIRLREKGLLDKGVEHPLWGWKDIGGSKLSFRTLPRICGELLTLVKRYPRPKQPSISV